jgi:hypothetical protein
MRVTLFLVVILVSTSAMAQHLGDTYKPTRHWVKLMNKFIAHEGDYYAAHMPKCIISEEQEARVVHVTEEAVVIRLVGHPLQTGTNCPASALYKLSIKELASYIKIEDMYMSQFCGLDDTEKMVVDRFIAVDSPNNGNSIAENSLRAISQCSKKSNTIDYSRESQEPTKDDLQQVIKQKRTRTSSTTRE